MEITRNCTEGPVDVGARGILGELTINYSENWKFELRKMRNHTVPLPLDPLIPPPPP